MEEEKVEITRKEYRALLERDRFLWALECAGVDNWDGIDYAHEILETIEEENK